ncbi:MAG: ABC transporter substrate-binding protein, partial [Candidatus Latescibacterota bacterium]
MNSCRPAKHIFHLVCVLLCIWSSSCSTSDNSSTPPRNEGGTLLVGLLSDPATLNPLVATTTEEKDIIERIFMKLLDEEDDFLNFTPRLARSWQFSDDGMSVTFALRDDVTWTDGTPCTAHDVRFTWQLQTDTLIAWPSRHLKDRISDVHVIDDHTVRFHFSRRYPYQLMDANDGVIVPKHLLENIPRGQFRAHSFGRRPVGNGPFQLKEWLPGQYVELVPNADYYEEGKPHLDRVVFRIVPDMLTQMIQLKAGEIDCLEAIPADAVAELTERYKDIQIYKYPSRSMTYIAWNLTDVLFADRDVRRALTMAIDRSAIIAALMNGMAAECRSPMSPLIWAYDPDIEPLPFHAGEARRILAELGWKDTDGDGVLDKGNRPFEFEMITNNSNQLRVDIMTMAQA